MTSPTPPIAEPAGVWEDFVDIFYAPSSVYARRENGNFWLPLIVVTILLGMLWVVSSRVLEPVFDVEWNRQAARMMEQNPQLTTEQVEGFRTWGERFQTIGAFIFIPATILIVGVVLWLMGKLFDAKQTVRSALVVTAFAYMPRVIEQLLALAEGFIRDPAGLDGRNRLSWGIGRFLDPDTTSPALLGMMMRVDVFTIWVTVLLAIGLAVTGKISRRNAAMAAALVWLIGAIPTMLAAMRA